MTRIEDDQFTPLEKLVGVSADDPCFMDLLGDFLSTKTEDEIDGYGTMFKIEGLELKKEGGVVRVERIPEEGVPGWWHEH